MKRLTKTGIITTIVGLLLIGFSGVMLYMGKATTTETAGFFALGGMMLRSKDSLIGIKDKEDGKSS